MKTSTLMTAITAMAIAFSGVAFAKDKDGDGDHDNGQKYKRDKRQDKFEKREDKRQEKFEKREDKREERAAQGQTTTFIAASACPSTTGTGATGLTTGAATA
jgi:hypothetical protein